MPSGPVSLRDLKTLTLHIDCAKCDRHGQYAIARLLEIYSPDLLLKVFVDIASRNCPPRTTQGNAERYAAFCEELLQPSAAPAANAYARAKGDG
jgi:hypothetical protein